MFYRPPKTSWCQESHVSVAMGTMDFWNSRVPAWAAATRKRHSTFMYRVVVSLRCFPGAPEVPETIDRQIYRSFTGAAYPKEAARLAVRMVNAAARSKPPHLQDMLVSHRRRVTAGRSARSRKRSVDAVAPMWESAMGTGNGGPEPVERRATSAHSAQAAAYRDDDIRPVNVGHCVVANQVADPPSIAQTCVQGLFIRHSST